MGEDLRGMSQLNLSPASSSCLTQGSSNEHLKEEVCGCYEAKGKWPCSLKKEAFAVHRMNRKLNARHMETDMKQVNDNEGKQCLHYQNFQGSMVRYREELDESKVHRTSGLQELTSEAIDLSCSANGAASTPKRGYRHRHERMYGLSETEKKKRRQILNNEASQLYREKAKAKMEDLEDLLKKEEERQEELLRQQHYLQKILRRCEEVMRTEQESEKS